MRPESKSLPDRKDIQCVPQAGLSVSGFELANFLEINFHAIKYRIFDDRKECSHDPPIS